MSNVPNFLDKKVQCSASTLHSGPYAVAVAGRMPRLPSSSFSTSFALFAGGSGMLVATAVVTACSFSAVNALLLLYSNNIGIGALARPIHRCFYRPRCYRCQISAV